MIYLFASHNNHDGLQKKIGTIYRKNYRWIQYYNRRLDKWLPAQIGAGNYNTFRFSKRNDYTFVNEADKIKFETDVVPELSPLADEIF